MKLTNGKKKAIKLFFLAALLLALLGAFTACGDLGYPPTAPTSQPAPEAATSSTLILTKDAALLAVYQRLLGEAETYEAKTYLADFYAACDNWSAESEFFKDGSGTWYVTVDMTGTKNWQGKPYWQQASWFVFKDGQVIPSNRFQANALRIEADLQSLSLKPSPAPNK